MYRCSPGTSAEYRPASIAARAEAQPSAPAAIAAAAATARSALTAANLNRRTKELSIGPILSNVALVAGGGCDDTGDRYHARFRRRKTHLLRNLGDRHD